jgi:ATP-dependent RNA helicase DeaD
MSLKDYLKETLDLGRDDVFKVDVKEGFSLTQIQNIPIKK